MGHQNPMKHPFKVHQNPIKHPFEDVTFWLFTFDSVTLQLKFDRYKFFVKLCHQLCSKPNWEETLLMAVVKSLNCPSL